MEKNNAKDTTIFKKRKRKRQNKRNTNFENWNIKKNDDYKHKHVAKITTVYVHMVVLGFAKTALPNLRNPSFI